MPPPIVLAASEDDFGAPMQIRETPLTGATRLTPRVAWAASAGVTVTWAVAVIAAGQLGRVADNWEAGATMLFGSFLAGSSPEGGGAVAFPVLTKGLDVSAPVARTFGLCIQAVGMTVAAISIVLCRRPVHWRSAAIATTAAVAGFLASVFLVGEPDQLFWPPSIGTPWVKATFSILLATTSVMMVRHLRSRGGPPLVTRWTRRADAALVLAAIVGGFVSALTGTGANILVFLFLVALVDVNPKVALPTAIIVMAAVSVLGLVLFGLVDGQLDTTVADGVVTSVGGVETSLDASTADLLGLWLAAVPIVAWGAPLGALAASLVTERRLVQFVAFLATVEVVTTFALVPELRSQPSLMIYLVAGLVAVPASCIWLRTRRQTLLGD